MLLPYFWDLIIDTAQEEWDEFVEIRVPVPHVKQPIADDRCHGFSNLERDGRNVETAELTNDFFIPCI